MKKIIAALTLVAALSAAPSVRAVTVDCSSTGQYGGGATCGVSTTTETQERTYDAGVSDWQLWQVLASIFGVAVAASILYKLTYRVYIFG